jgi:hypothetical protein
MKPHLLPAGGCAKRLGDSTLSLAHAALQFYFAAKVTDGGITQEMPINKNNDYGKRR